MNKANNQRVKETHRRIIEAVYRMLLEEKKPLAKITVRDVCERAEIHRSTFYAHYQDIYDVVERVEKNMSVLLTETFLHQLDEGAHAETCYESLFAFIAEHRGFYRVYLNEMHQAGVIGVAAELFQDRIGKKEMKLFGSADEAAQKYHMDFYLYGITALVRRWLDRDCRETPQELFQILRRQSEVQQGMMGW